MRTVAAKFVPIKEYPSNYQQFPFKDEFLSAITEGDMVMSFHKFEAKSNFKANLDNSLGYLEFTGAFRVIAGLLKSISRYYSLTSKGEDRSCLVEEVKLLDDLAVKLSSEFASKFPVKQAGTYKKDIESLFTILQLLIKLLKISIDLA